MSAIWYHDEQQLKEATLSFEYVQKNLGCKIYTQVPKKSFFCYLLFYLLSIICYSHYLLFIIGLIFTSIKSILFILFLFKNLNKVLKLSSWTNAEDYVKCSHLFFNLF